MADWLGKTLGKVRIELLLARGGMAEVYLGTHTTLQRPVAVKLLRNQFLEDRDLLDRFQREARVVAMLRHPNIVQVFDFDTHNGQPFLVMEYVPGLTLGTYMRELHQRGSRLDLTMINQLLFSLAGALEYAHDSGVIHRDVKPGNIILTSRTQPIERARPLPFDVQPVVTDFGLVRLMHSGSHTATGQIAGTPAYMSPEQARGDRTDGRTDIYSLGIVLYEMLAGRPPFEADTSLGVLMKQISEPPQPVPGLAPSLQDVLGRVLQKKPEDRYQTPTELARAFNAALSLQSQASTITPSGMSPLKTPRSSSRSPMLARMLPVLLGLGLLALMTVVLWQAGGQRPSPAPLPTQETHAAPGGIPVVAGNPTASPELEAIGILRMQNGTSLADRATFSALQLPLPAAEQQYEVWLLGDGGESRRSMGTLALDAGGQGNLSFVDPDGRNLVERFDTLEITLEPRPDPNPNPTGAVAFNAALPGAGLIHVKHLLVGFSSTPGKIGLVHGLLQDAELLDQFAHEMLESYERGEVESVARNAESMLNLLVGSQSPDYKDWDEDGTVESPGDGFGMLLNGDNIGYIEGTFSHASYTATSENATRNMILHGTHVQVCMQNLEGWTPQLHSLLTQVMSAGIGPESEPALRHAVALADQILEGTDLDGDEQVEPIPGEGGARTAYQHAYYMADITIYAPSK